MKKGYLVTRNDSNEYIGYTYDKKLIDEYIYQRDKNSITVTKLFKDQIDNILNSKSYLDSYEGDPNRFVNSSFNKLNLSRTVLTDEHGDVEIVASAIEATKLDDIISDITDMIFQNMQTIQDWFATGPTVSDEYEELYDSLSKKGLDLVGNILAVSSHNNITNLNTYKLFCEMNSYTLFGEDKYTDILDMILPF